MAHAPSAAAKRHWTRVAALGCILCGAPAEIAHAHGPSLSARGFQKPKGKLFEWQHWLVIPLCAMCHRLGTVSLDNATESWERSVGYTCAQLVDIVVRNLGVDVWAEARKRMKAPVSRSAAQLLQPTE